jgi:hypothetical protein
VNLKRWVARFLLAVVAFAQASLAFADCPADRGGLGHALSAETMVTCQSGMISMSESGPLYANRCLAHCTADLQIQATGVAIVRSAADAPVLFVPLREYRPLRAAGLQGLPPGAPPLRIVLHSFLI